MILVDTSIWVDHLRSGEERLVRLLDQGLVLIHPFVIGEIALGRLRQRALILDLLQNPPRAGVASDGEVLSFIERYALSGFGIGYVDAHLLAAVRLTPGSSLWTRDKRLTSAATKLSLAVDFSN